MFLSTLIMANKVIMIYIFPYIIICMRPKKFEKIISEFFTGSDLRRLCSGKFAIYKYNDTNGKFCSRIIIQT